MRLPYVILPNAAGGIILREQLYTLNRFLPILYLTNSEIRSQGILWLLIKPRHDHDRQLRPASSSSQVSTDAKS